MNLYHSPCLFPVLAQEVVAVEDEGEGGELERGWAVVAVGDADEDAAAVEAEVPARTGTAAASLPDFLLEPRRRAEFKSSNYHLRPLRPGLGKGPGKVNEFPRRVR
jgi:hypothetical protein